MTENALKRETNAYFTHMGVETSTEASILANEHTWTIIEILRGSGAKGLKAEEVQDAIEKEEGVKVSRSKIYALLRRLYEMEILHKHYDSEKNAHVYTHARLAGQIEIDPEFFGTVDDKMSKYIERKLFPVFEEFVEKTIAELDSDEKTKHWLPDHGKHSFCVRCQINHESEEFVDSIISIASALFLESDRFTKLVKKKKFADEKFELV